jgi:hypothetical protein
MGFTGQICVVWGLRASATE